MSQLPDLSNPKSIASYIDHTLLKPDINKMQIRQLCEEALENQFYAVCVNSWLITACREVLRNTKVQIAAVVGFPLGACESSTKSYESSRAFNLGAHEVDMVINVGAIKSGEASIAEREIREVVRTGEGRIVKVILETSLLTDDEKKLVCELATNAGAHFVKTSTGFGGGGATVEDIKLMKAAVNSRVRIKASGGIRTYETAKSMIEAGATRLGTSSGINIIKNIGSDNSSDKNY